MNKCYLDRTLDLICLHTWKIVKKNLMSDIWCPFRVFWAAFIKSGQGTKYYKQSSLVQHLNNKLHFTKAIKLETLIYPPDQGNKTGYIII